MGILHYLYTPTKVLLQKLYQNNYKVCWPQKITTETENWSQRHSTDSVAILCGPWTTEMRVPAFKNIKIALPDFPGTIIAPPLVNF